MGSTMFRHVVLAAGLITMLGARASEGSSISFTDGSFNSVASASVFVDDAAMLSWTQTVTTTNTTVSAYVMQAPGRFEVGTAWLSIAIGPGATIADQIAETAFIAPPPGNGNNLNLDTPAPIFTGLTLSPGTYYLVISGGVNNGPFVNSSYTLLGDFLNVGIHTDPGFSVGPQGIVFGAAPFAPASAFNPPFPFEPSALMFFQVDAAPAVPEPGTLILIGTGLLAASRRMRVRRIR